MTYRPYGRVICAILCLVATACCEAAPGAATGTSANHAEIGVRTSPRYRIEASIGGWANQGSSDAGWLKPDVAGVWVNPKRVEVVSEVAALPEGQATQVKSRVRCDDESIIADGFDTYWLAADGPIFSSGDGWMTAQPVYQDTPATVQATAFGMTGQQQLTVINSDPDNYGLYAGDDIDDTWQVAHYGPSNAWGMAGTDYDEDGADNYYEFTSGTDPLSANEFFALKTITKGAGVEIGIGPLATNRIYIVERAMLMSTGSWSGYTNISLAAPSNLMVLANAETGTNMAFYRVAIHYPWRDP